METKSDRIKRLREYGGLTRRQLAKLAGVSPSTISELERGSFDPKPETCHKIAKALGLPPEAILDMPPGSGYDNPQPYIVKKLPLLGHIPCGEPRENWEVIEWVDVLLHLWKPNRFLLRADGDSMAPMILNRDLVLIDAIDGLTLENADHKICALDYDGEQTLKYVDVEWKDGKPVKVVLRPRNDQFKAIDILPGRFEKLKICGFAVSIQRDL